MAWEPLSPSEPAMKPLTAGHLARMSSGQTPEEILIARETAEEPVRRRMSPAMRTALLWLTTEPPERVKRMMAWLPLEEAYIVKRYLIGKETQADIARDVGVSQIGVSYRLRRALWRLRALSDLAWDASEQELRSVLGPHLAGHQVEIVVQFWACRFSQSRVAELRGRKQGTIRQHLLRITGTLAPVASSSRQVKRLHRTLVEVARRKLWYVAGSLPLSHALTLPAA